MIVLEENIYKTHDLKLLNREVLTISGVNKIDNFDNYEFIIHTIMGKIIVKGVGLEVLLLDTDKGNIKIKGKINSINYLDNKKSSKESVFAKLFK